MSTDHDVADAAIAAVAHKGTMAGAGAAVIGWATSSEAGVVIGIVIGVAGLMGVRPDHIISATFIIGATLAAIAALAPQTLEDLQGVSGIGAKKLDAYGPEVLRVLLSN